MLVFLGSKKVGDASVNLVSHVTLMAVKVPSMVGSPKASEPACIVHVLWAGCAATNVAQAANAATVEATLVIVVVFIVDADTARQKRSARSTDRRGKSRQRSRRQEGTRNKRGTENNVTFPRRLPVAGGPAAAQQPAAAASAQPSVGPGPTAGCLLLRSRLLSYT